MWFFVQLCSSVQDFNWLKTSRGPSAIAELLVCLLRWIVSFSWRLSISAVVKLQLLFAMLRSFCKYYRKQTFSPFSIDCDILVKCHVPNIKGPASEATNLQRSQLVSATVRQLHYTLTSNCLFNPGSVNGWHGSYGSLLHLPLAKTARMLPDHGYAYINVSCWSVDRVLRVITHTAVCILVPCDHVWADTRQMSAHHMAFISTVSRAKRWSWESNARRWRRWQNLTIFR